MSGILMLSMIVLKGNLNTFILIFSVYICPSIQNSQVVSRLPWYNNQGKQAPEKLPGRAQGKKTEKKLKEKSKSFIEVYSNIPK